MTAKKPAPLKSLNEKSDDHARGKFPIAGIGASAGGLEALDQFFRNMPETSGMAFVIVQHLDPHHKGIMPELIQRVTPMKVSQVTDHLKVKQNNVYVIPPNKYMSILNGSLYLFDIVEPLGLRLPIDFFFNSLADDLRDKSIGVILSGMGSDGSHGMRSIKEKSGIVLVQDPSTAKFDSMPRSAIDTVPVDIIASPAELPGRLINYVKQILTINTESALRLKERSSLDKIILLIRSHTGNDFSQYKKSTLYRRIERRMAIHKIERIVSYIRFLQENSNEIDVLFQELLIGATSFFRDAGVWDHLKEKVLPSVLSNKPNGYVLRIWIPACSTGEEAYSFAIIVKEALDQMKLRNKISCQIFASDLDNHAIARARRGYFYANSISAVSGSHLNRFFTKSGDGYKINTEIREMILFARQNIIDDPPFTKLDILSCRNLLIYLEPELQKRLLSVFHYSLKPSGYLILGTSETLGSQNQLFSSGDARLRIFQKTLIDNSDPVDFPTSSRPIKPPANEYLLPVKSFDNIQSLTDHLILEQYSPASALVTNKGDIIYLTRRAGKYLEPAAGKANMNIFAMLREGLSLEFPIAFRKAIQNYEKIILKNVRVDNTEAIQYVDVIIQQLEKPNALKGMIIVVFRDTTAAIKKGTGRTKKGIPAENVLNEEMELEQQRLREELQNTLEAMQVSEEELKSSNEELQSTNEELQSTNEELTTSKEELQSMNEELQTVNIELMSKVDEFTRISNDMKNLLDSTDIATLFLDKDLHIRRYTNSATKIFKLIQGDIGRSITDLSTDLIYPEFYDEMQDVLRTLVSIEKSIRIKSGKWFSVRLMPYRTTDDRIDGLVITFTDITTAKNLETELNETISGLRGGRKN